MSFATRLSLFVAIAVAGLVAWHWNSALEPSHELTLLAVQQFQNSDANATHLQHASLAQNWWPLAGPALLLLVGVVLFWDDAERWWKRESA